MEESESSFDSDSNNDDINVNIPSITGNFEVDKAIYNHPHRFQNVIYYPLSADGEWQNGIPLENVSGNVNDNATCRAYPTSTGLFVIEQKKKDLNNKHQRAQICRNILCALDQLTSLQLPRNHQDFIIRQVVGQDFYPMPLYFGPNGTDSDSDGDKEDILDDYAARFVEQIIRRERKRKWSSSF